MKRNVIVGALVGLAVVYAFLVGLGPIRRVAGFVIPEVLHQKVTVNSVCAEGNRIYVFQSDNGSFSTIVVADGCKNVDLTSGNHKTGN